MNSRQTILTSANRKKKLIYQTDLEDANSLANHAPGKEMLYTLEEIAILTEDLMSLGCAYGCKWAHFRSPSERTLV